MPRQVRRQFAGAIYHLMNRGDRREEIFRDAPGPRLFLAALLREETTMSLKWIAQHLEMGSWTHVSNLLGTKRKQDSLKSEN
jgi:hypothetical protein